MSSDIVIRAENLGKKYVIGHQSAERVPTLRDSIVRSAGSFLRGTREMLRGGAIVAGDETEEFWALKDVNFEVRRGEVLGIIGRNGAGKSTLLKVLSRITEPSEGRVEIKGRVASLLEVGTGFHPELSGRENIFLNGAILGMSRREIKAKFDEIVDFSEVERFLDTPVKRYSSGMYVRLAFAVAAHLEPEILVVDEVLAVGDAEFQKKCLGKMQDVAGGGRTVLFVSHNLGAISALCERAIELAAGRVIEEGPSGVVTESHLSRMIDQRVQQNSRMKFDQSLHVEVKLAKSQAQRGGEPCRIDVAFSAMDAGTLVEAKLILMSATGVRVAIIDLRRSGELPLHYGPGEFKFSVDLVSLPLVEGPYSLGMWIVTNNHGDNLFDLCEFMVLPARSEDFAVYSPHVRGYLEIDSNICLV
jgi:lipopolysaccharide transport system ATP-binding protein